MSTPGTWTWEDAVVVITGASRGIGETIAADVAQRGARAGLIARSAGDLAGVLDRIGGPERGAFVAADVSNRDEVVGAIGQLERSLGPTDVLVANAGIGAYGPFADVAADDIDRLVGVNVLGTLHAVRAVVPGMIERRRGHIVVVGSIAGRIGAPFEALYSATKFAQVGLTESLSVELAPYGIGVSMVNPGPVKTSFFEARGHAYDRDRPRPVAPEAVAAAVIAAVEDRRLEQFVPRWFRAAVAARHVVPRLYQAGTLRTFRRELADDMAARRR